MTNNDFKIGDKVILDCDYSHTMIVFGLSDNSYQVPWVDCYYTKNNGKVKSVRILNPNEVLTK